MILEILTKKDSFTFRIPHDIFIVLDQKCSASRAKNALISDSASKSC